MTRPQGPRLVDLFPEAIAVGEALRAARLTIAVAESCTGGLLGAALTAVPGSSAYVRGGLITYSNDLKSSLLEVPEPLIAEHGAASEPVARLMAEGARRRCAADVGIGVTGIAGPAADGTAKTVGLIHIAVAGPAGAAGHVALNQDLGREENRAAAVRTALGLSVRLLAGLAGGPSST